MEIANKYIMRRNHQPLWLYRIKNYFRSQYTKIKLCPQFDSVGKGLMVFQPRTLKIFGANIHAGQHLHIISNKFKPVQISTWQSKQQQGSIKLGDYALISPGVQISSAEGISIGDNCMIGAEASISDSDWHGIYNRTRPFRCSAPVVIHNNVWIGQRAMIGKGVTIGENSIVAAGSVVVSDVAENTIVGGNPASTIKQLEPTRRMLTREFLFTQSTDYDENQRLLAEYLCSGNTTLNWLRTHTFPTHND